MMFRYNRYALLGLICLAGIATTSLEAQVVAPTKSYSPSKATPRTIFEALEGEAVGEGIVVIEQSNELKRLVGGISTKYSSILGREGNTTIMHGYRIQVYNSNLAQGKAEMERRASEIRRLAPQYSCYTSYNAPFWRLVLGDFVSREAARQAQNKLSKLLPQWFKEAYVVRDKVRIINYNPELNEY